MRTSIVASVFVIAVLASCKPETKGELGAPFNKVAGMEGTWEISGFSQLDLNNPVQEVRDLSEFYVVEGETQTSITFGSDFTYSVQAGSGKNYFGTSGTWAFDNNEFPTQLFLQNTTDTLTFSLGSVVREFDTELNIELPRYCTDLEGVQTPTVIYQFQFSRQ